MRTYAALHQHSEASSLDGMSRATEMAQRAKEIGLPAIAITDHGNVSGLPRFYDACKEQGVGAVLGLEGYFVPRFSIAREERWTKANYNHITVLARGEPGYRVLCELATASNHQFYREPLLDRDLFQGLGAGAQHLTILTGCLQGPLSKAAQIGRTALMEEFSWWRKTFPHLYIEIQHHGIDIDEQVTNELLWLARETGTPWVPTGDSHFSKKEDAAHHDVLLAIQMGKDVDDPTRMRFDGEGFWIQSAAEMRKAFSCYPKEVWEKGAATSLEIASDCIATIPEWEKKTWHVPDIPDVDDPFDTIRLIVKQQLIDRKLGAAYIRRAKEELTVIKKMDVAGFLYVAHDCIHWAKSKGIYVGPGRGSVCGSLVAYLLDIHRVDPVSLGLRFDRFLNPERPRMPDIDTDFAASRRDELFAYVREKYGEDCVMNICTISTMKLKRAFKSLAKVHGISFVDSNRMTADMIDDPETEADEQIPEEVDRNYPLMAAQLEAIKGLKCGFGAHPAGVVIAPRSYGLHQHVPQMYLASSKRWVSQYDMTTMEQLGLLKQDLLGLKTLDVIDHCLQMVKDRTGEDVDPTSWQPDKMPWDPQVYAMLSTGVTAGIFQFKGGSMRTGAKRMKISCFVDMMQCLAAFRKGPAKAGDADVYVKNKKSGRISYLHPSLELILGKTHGALIFQEQVLEIGEQIAGLDTGTNDDLLRALAKKKHDLMATVEPVFLEGCIERGVPEDTAYKLWSQIRESAHYLFNTAHSGGYARQAYECASLKVLYPLEFYCALLQSVDDKEERRDYLKEIVQNGIRILRPHINRSDMVATPDHENNAIRFGLMDVKGVGEKVARRLLEHRGDGYWTLSAILDVCNHSRVVENLEASGALRVLGGLHDPDREQELLGWSFTDRMAPHRKKLKARYEPPYRIYGEVTSIVKKKTKKGDPFWTWTVRWSPAEEFKVQLWKAMSRYADVKTGTIVKVEGVWDRAYSSVSCNKPSDIKILKEPGATP